MVAWRSLGRGRVGVTIAVMTQPRHAVGDPSDASTSDRGLEIVGENDREADRVGDLERDLAVDAAGDETGDAVVDRDAATLADRRRDPERDLDLDADSGSDEVWFDADDLAAASQVELGVVHGGHTASLEQLREAMGQPGISLASLPGWPDAGAHGQGLGPELAELIGELRPGDVVLFGGRGRHLGRTSLLAQLADGLALGGSPVVCIVEHAPLHWRARSLARFAGVDARVFVDPGWTRREADAAAWVDRFAASAWGELDRRQRFVSAAARMDIDWRAGHGGEVWPVVIVDPLEQLEARGGLEALARVAAEHRLIVLASHDARDETRAIDRYVHARMQVSVAGDGGLEVALEHRRLGPRGSVRLCWDRASGRIWI